MKSFEDMLPKDQSLDGTIEDFRSEIYDILDDYQADTGDVIDSAHELNHDILGLDHFSRVFSDKYAANDETEARRVHDAIYRAICFAAQVSDEALPARYNCEILGYIRERLADSESLEPLEDDVQQYLQHRPEVDTLLSYYMPEIDLSGRYNHVAELFGGMVFMLSERSVGEQYVTAQIEHVAPDDFEQYFR